MPKIHRCKAKGCNKTVDRTYSSTTQVCSISCAVAWGREKEAKKRSKEVKANRKDVRDLNRRTLSWQHKLTQKVFNRMRVLEEMQWFKSQDIEPTCISCNKPDMDFCCGHLKTVASQGNLRYDRENSKIQCNRYCNKGLSGNIEGNKSTRGYKTGLLERFGQEEGQRIIDYCTNSTSPANWTCDQLETMRKQFNSRIRQLEADNELSNM